VTILAVGLVGLVILLHAGFTAVEVALVSVTRARMQHHLETRDEVDPGGSSATPSLTPARSEGSIRFILDLIDNSEPTLLTARLLVTVLEVAVLLTLGVWVALNPPSWIDDPTTAWLAGVSVAVTLGLLIFWLGHLLPGRLAERCPERVIVALAWALRPLRPLLGWLPFWLDQLGVALLNRLSLPMAPSPAVTHEEIADVLESGVKAGLLDPFDQDMLERLLKLGDRRVSVVMTPRVDVVWLDVNDSPEELANKLQSSPHSRFPVCEDFLDNLVGVVHVKSLLVRSLRGERVDLRGLVQIPMLVPDTLTTRQLLDRFREPGNHLAIVIDEFGGVRGLATLTDVLEAIVGDLPDEGESFEEDVVRREDGSLLLDAMLSIDELKEVLEVGSLPDEDRGEYQTLAGFVITRFGYIPKIGESFVWRGFRFEVVDTDGARLDRILVQSIPRPPTPISNEDSSAAPAPNPPPSTDPGSSP